MTAATFYGVERVVDDIKKMPASMRAKLREAVKQGGEELAEYIKANKLSGSPVGVRSGRLRDSITSVMYESNSEVSATVGSDVAYARVLDLGFNGSVQVKEHLRTITKAFGKQIKAGSTTFTVHAHQMRMNIAPRSFMAAAIAEFEPRFVELVDAAIGEVIA